MDQQCSKRTPEKSKPTQYWFDSPFAVISIIFFFQKKLSWLVIPNISKTYPQIICRYRLPLKLFLDVKADRIVEDETCRKSPQCSPFLAPLSNKLLSGIANFFLSWLFGPDYLLLYSGPLLPVSLDYLNSLIIWTCLGSFSDQIPTLNLTESLTLLMYITDAGLKGYSEPIFVRSLFLVTHWFCKLMETNNFQMFENTCPKVLYRIVYFKYHWNMTMSGWMVNLGAKLREARALLYISWCISANPSIHTQVQWEKHLGILLNSDIEPCELKSVML